jgi:peptidyl-prolyl cis-trans isomerase D
MLDVFRKKKNIKIIMFFIAVIIIPAFVLWGVGSVLSSKKKESIAGIVFSKRISRDDFIKEYQAVHGQARLIYGDNLNKVQNILNLEGQAWQRIILLEEAKRRAIKISDAEVIAEIQSSPIFQRDNVFSKESYDTMLRYYLGLRPQQYEEQIRSNLKIRTLVGQVTEDISITEEETWENFRAKDSLFKLGYILIKSQDFLENIEYEEDDILDFYNKNKELFKKPEQVNLEYLEILTAKIASEITVSEEEIESYLKNHQEDLLNMRDQKDAELDQDSLRREASQYLTRIKARDKAQDLIWKAEDSIRSNRSISDVAENLNLSLNETGFFSPWDPIPGIGWAYNITEQAFSLNAGETSSAIEIKNGFYIIKVKEKRAPYIPEFNESREAVLKEFLNRKSDELAKDYSEELLTSLKSTWDDPEELQNTLLLYDLEFAETDYINRGSYIRGLGNAADILDLLEKDKVGLNAEAVPIQTGYIIVKTEDIKAPSKEDFEKEKERLREELLIQKKNDALNNWFAEIKEEADLEVYFSLPQ